MANTLFSNWSSDFSDLPKFEDFIQKNGKSHSSSANCLSQYNKQRTGKRATLHHATINSIEKIGSIITAVAENRSDSLSLAYGEQLDQNGNTTHCIVEYPEKDGSTTVAVYIPNTGVFKAVSIDANGNAKNMQPIANGKYEGDACIFLLGMWSYNTNPEFTQDVERYYNASDPLNRGDIENMFRMCDNLYRRVTTPNSQDALACNIPTSGNLPKITQLEIDNGVYTPSQIMCGKFRYLTAGSKKRKRSAYKSISDLQRAFGMKIELSAEERRKIAVIDEAKYVPSRYLIEMAQMINAGMRVFMLRGEAGTGKTTDVRALSYVLGLPYRRFTCSENTDETSLVVNMIPNTGRNICREEINYPTLQDITMDPATAVSKVSGVYMDGIDSDAAFSKILHLVAEQSAQASRNDKDFVMVESEIVKGCALPSVVEIQEPACIARQATLVALNSLLDDGKSITLMDGTEIERNPNSIFVFTTNSNYRGCREFNESVLSRMEEIIDYSQLSAKEMIARVMKKTGISKDEEPNLKIMAEIIRDIQDYCRVNQIIGGVCGNREYENWVRSYMVKGNMKESCIFTVISKITKDMDDQQAILDSCVETKLG